MEAISKSQLRFQDSQIEMAHGAGGKAARRLVEGLIAPLLSNPLLDRLEDAAILSLGMESVAFTADSFVVRPIQFPGGSIGKLAVNGTANDLAVAGAKPVALVLTMILEAGTPTSVVQKELEAIAAAAQEVGVQIVGGDTKVVEHGKAEEMYLTTAGIGKVHPGAQLGIHRVKAGDKILLSGPIGDHGITILLARGELALEAELRSDTRAVWPYVRVLLDVIGEAVHWMRDPTRGGVASVLNELARDTGLGILIEESSIPLRAEVRGACEILGLDPLHIANEGQFIAIVDPQYASEALALLHELPGGKEAAIIGEVQEAPARTVLGRNPYGGMRAIDMLVGDPLPRIC